jgi:uroporphyrinogen-III decarboxylase
MKKEMSSRERMLDTIEYKETDHTPCSFMIFENLFHKSRDQEDYIRKEIDMGMDAVVNVGKLTHSVHEDAHVKEWTEDMEGDKYFMRMIDTPGGPLTQKVIQKNGWPHEKHFPIFDDWLIPRSREVLVKPERDLEKLPYLLGDFKKQDIDILKQEAGRADRLAKEHDLLQAAGLIGWGYNGIGWWTYQIACVDVIGWLSGFENPMMLSLTDPSIMEQYVDTISKWSIKQVEIYLDVTKADLIARRAWYETTEFWTPDAFRKIVAPTIRKEADLVHQAGRKYGYIMTAAFLPILDDILDSGIDVLIGLDPIEGKGTDMGVVKERFLEKKKAIWGGVSGAVTVENGTGKDTEDAVKEALRILAPAGGFILSPVDNVSDDTENAWKNTEVFMNTWKKYRK